MNNSSVINYGLKGATWCGGIAVIGTFLFFTVLGVIEEGLNFEVFGELLISIPMLFAFFGMPILIIGASVGFIFGILFGWLKK